MIKKILMASTIAILLGVVALPVLAIPPDHLSYSFPEAPFQVADCGEFEVWSKDSTIFINETVHYDKEGNPTKAISHWRGEGAIWRPDTGKEINTDSNLFTAKFDFETGTTTSAGIQLKVTIPGEGKLLMDVGRIVFDPFPNIIWEAGQHPYWLPEEGDFDKLCNWFAE